MLPRSCPEGKRLTYPRSVTPFSIVVGYGGVSWAEPRFTYHTWRGGREAVVAEFGREVRLFVCPEFPRAAGPGCGWSDRRVAEAVDVDPELLAHLCAHSLSDGARRSWVVITENSKKAQSQ